jgi:hypothetical protein
MSPDSRSIVGAPVLVTGLIAKEERFECKESSYGSRGGSVDQGASFTVSCGSRPIDVRPNWKEEPERPSLTGKQWR